MSKKKWLLLPAFLLLIQLFRPARTNPQTPPDLSLDAVNPVPAQVHQLLHTACFNCHSNQTVWPWYSKVAPFSWVIADDVKRARRQLNFSEWGGYDTSEKAHDLKKVRDILKEGDMPPWDYRLVHSDARLSDAEITTLRNWAGQERQKLVQGQK
jgi:hypothetical protein